MPGKRHRMHVKYVAGMYLGRVESDIGVSVMDTSRWWLWRTIHSNAVYWSWNGKDVHLITQPLCFSNNEGNCTPKILCLGT